MCEWLCRREWCDVRLQCGVGAGRTLPAHRAVLASVSAFLRRILLSSPTEETPTLIVLPDFDLEAMTSVLYYIYNGEVVIQKHKLERFMEIVRAMQIFVDDHYLPTSCKSVENSTSCAQEYNQNSVESKTYHLGEGPFINLKKRSQNCVPNNIDLDKHVQCENINDACLGNKQSSLGNRERSFLRDLFMETYPRNGNANGWTAAAGVLAMPSALYRPPPSDPLTNANGIHLHSDTHAQMLNQPTDTPCVINYPQNLNRILIPPKGSDKVTSTEYSRLAHFKKIASELLPTSSKNCDITKSSRNSQRLSVILKRYHHPSQDFIEQNSVDIAYTELLPNILESPFNQCLIDSNKSHTGKIINVLPGSSSSPKGAILNQVLDSPWCNRQPTNYRPFKRKLQNSTDMTSKDITQKAFNDDNNNVQTSSTADEVERLSANTLEKMYPAPSLLVGSGFKCTVCDQVFTDSETLAAHARRHSSVAKYSCTECSKSFSQLRNFKYHMSIHRGTREFAATCTVCGKYFNDRGYLSSHMKIHRNRKEYKCSQCPKSFNQRVAYNMHVRIHTGVKPHVCGECGKAFSRKMLLKQHQRTHSGERPYACAHCDKRFADRSNMTLHLRLHTGIKPFSCTLCPKSFTKKHHLKSHLNFHTGAKPYSCPKCKLAFTQSSNMRTHLKKCTAPDPVEIAKISASN